MTIAIHRVAHRRKAPVRRDAAERAGGTPTGDRSSAATVCCVLHQVRLEYQLARRQAEQKTDPEIRRCLKRYTARHLFRLMETMAR